ncbi:MAG TPA: integrase, partial [Pseudonocardiaceae bacterium]|nr:integrase [Pseudonocardiaceae bacterium]
MKISMEVLVSDACQAFFAARRPRKDSPHTTAAYRRDLAGIVGLLAYGVGRSADVLTVG